MLFLLRIHVRIKIYSENESYCTENNNCFWYRMTLIHICSKKIHIYKGSLHQYKNNLFSKLNFSLYKKGENSPRNFATLFWVTKN